MTPGGTNKGMLSGSVGTAESIPVGDGPSDADS